MGKKKTDSEGAPISGVRMDASNAYAGIPGLLQKFINENYSQAWKKITHKIDYMYINLDSTLGGLNRETGFGKEILLQINSGKKLLFKPYLVSPFIHR